jgi:glycine cleavage system aminomethyltransferase T
MRYTDGPRADHMEPRRSQLHDWANAWTGEIANAVGGLDVSGWHHVRQIVHEIRTRASIGDISHPAQPVSPQIEMQLVR